MNTKPSRIPVVAVGLGSQPTEDAPACLSMPEGMRTFAMPAVPEPGQFANDAGARRVIEQLCALIDCRLKGHIDRTVIDLEGLDDGQCALLNQSLGEGEVAARVSAPVRIEIQETVYAGVWRVRSFDSTGRLLQDLLEVAPAPAMVEFAAQASASDLAAAEPPAGVMNAPGVLSEIAGHLAGRRPGDPAWVINLSLLPGTPADADHLSRVLGVGPVSILSRGYGNCRITSTRVRNVWRVQFFNSQDTLILDTIEIATVPEAALAAREDLEDSRERLGELLQFIGEGS